MKRESEITLQDNLAADNLSLEQGKIRNQNEFDLQKERA